MLVLENLIRALLICNGLRSRHCQRALLGYHYLEPPTTSPHSPPHAAGPPACFSCLHELVLGLGIHDPLHVTPLHRSHGTDLAYSLTEQASEGTCCRQGKTVSQRAMGVITAVPWAGEEGSDRLQVSCIERDGLTMRGPCCLLRHARETQPWSTQTARQPHAAALRGTGLRGQRPRTAARRGEVRSGGACTRRAVPLLSGWRSAVRSAGRTRSALQHTTR